METACEGLLRKHPGAISAGERHASLDWRFAVPDHLDRHSTALEEVFARAERSHGRRSARRSKPGLLLPRHPLETCAGRRGQSWGAPNVRACPVVPLGHHFGSNIPQVTMGAIRKHVRCNTVGLVPCARALVGDARNALFDAPLP